MALCACHGNSAQSPTAIGCFRDVRLTCVASGWVVSGLALAAATPCLTAPTAAQRSLGGGGGGGVGGSGGGGSTGILIHLNLCMTENAV